MSKNPRFWKLPGPTTFPPTVPSEPMPPSILPAPYPPIAPEIAPFNPLPPTTLVAAPIPAANSGPTPGIKLANGPAIGAIFLATFFIAFPIFLKKPNSSSPVIGFSEAIPTPAIASSGSMPSSSNFLATVFSNCKSSNASGGRMTSPGRKCARAVSSPRPCACISNAISRSGALAPTIATSINRSSDLISSGSEVCVFCISSCWIACCNSWAGSMAAPVAYIPGSPANLGEPSGGVAYIPGSPANRLILSSNSGDTDSAVPPCRIPIA